MRNGWTWSVGLLLMLGGCAAEGDTSSRFVGEGADSAGGVPSSMGSSGSTPGGGTDPEPGTLTAGAWDDNRNFEHFEALLADNPMDTLPLTAEEQDAARARFAGEREANTRLDIALVLDTTGSMSDEIRYLQTELDAIAAGVAADYPDADTRWSLVVYRDETDAYVTQVYDFRDVDALRSDLESQSANGGGDFPEASHAALEDMSNLDWRDGEDVARIAFWVADAPHHLEQTGALTEALRTAANLDVHVYPIASSGVDLRTEISMRSGAQLTGGRYLFLTDDSGVGGEHLEPTVPCYFVTLLSDAMVRMIEIEMSGAYAEPTESQIIRTGGDPADGACVMDSGTYYVF
ncbi:MAG: VWA domain-containing protein [Sandaracinaceae bacterium]